MKIKDRDYLYASARVRALERHLLGHDDAERMLEAQSVADAVKILSELGYPELDSTATSLESAISAERERTFSLIRGISPNPAIADVFSIKYDYHNLKSLVKALATNQDAEHLLINSGRVDIALLVSSVKQDDFSALPNAMRMAYEEARDTLARTSDPQTSDFILDRACFREMFEYAKNSGSEFLLGYVRLLVDFLNLRAAVRALRQKKNHEFLTRIFLDGGNIAPQEITATISAEGSIGKVFAPSIPEAVSNAADDAISVKGNLTTFERMCDDALCDYLESAKYSAFGDAPLVAYLAAKEIELTNIRILLTAKLQNLPAAQIRERLRATYV